MPIVTAGKVLVTGANGYITTWVVHALLRQGYSVRGTVRSENKGAALKKLFAAYGEKLELVSVPDMTKDGAFDEAVKGVDAIEHTASPCNLNAGDPDELIVPAVNGTFRVLESALAHGKDVKRIVVTSSCGAITPQSMNGPRTFSEADWNDEAIEEVRTKGREASQMVKYRASKILAERAAWDFVGKHKGKLGWDLVVINPPGVYGPPAQDAKSMSELNDSMKLWFYSAFQGAMDTKLLGIVGDEWIDVRHLAEVHVLAIQKEEAAGERIIVSVGTWKAQDWRRFAHGQAAWVCRKCENIASQSCRYIQKNFGTTWIERSKHALLYLP